MKLFLKLSFLLLAVAVCFVPAAAYANGTVIIRQSDGHTDTYDDVQIKIIHRSLFLTTVDGHGTLIIDRAACSYQGQLMICYAAAVTLVQQGSTKNIKLKSGTIYVNSTDDSQQLVLSTMKVPPHSVMLSLTTAHGTYVALTGRIDKVEK